MLQEQHACALQGRGSELQPQGSQPSTPRDSLPSNSPEAGLPRNSLPARSPQAERGSPATDAVYRDQVSRISFCPSIVMYTRAQQHCYTRNSLPAGSPQAGRGSPTTDAAYRNQVSKIPFCLTVISDICAKQLCYNRSNWPVRSLQAQAWLAGLGYRRCCIHQTGDASVCEAIG